MAVDIMQTLVEFLCPTYSAQNACQQFINQPVHQVMQPFGPLLYFLFFPSVFLILLVYIGTSVLVRGQAAEHRGLRMLLAVAFFVFVVIQGLYPMMLIVGSLWFLLLPLLFILFFIIRHFSGGGGGGMPSIGGGSLGSKMTERLKVEVTGQRKDVEKTLESMLSQMRGNLNRIEKSGPGEDVDNVFRALAELVPQIDGKLTELRNLQAVPGLSLIHI